MAHDRDRLAILLLGHLNDAHTLEEAVATALEYGLFDLERQERLILRTIAKDYFVLPGTADTDSDDE